MRLLNWWSRWSGGWLRDRWSGGRWSWLLGQRLTLRRGGRGRGWLRIGGTVTCGQRVKGGIRHLRLESVKHRGDGRDGGEDAPGPA